MTLRRLIAGALPLVLSALLALAPARAAQDSFVMPSTGPMSMGTFVTSYLNPGLQALGSCHSGTSAPANGPSGAAMSGQCWWDTSGTPWSLKFYDGASWVAAGTLNASTHAFAFSGPLSLAGTVSPSQLTGDQDDYAATSGSDSCTNKTVLRVSTDASRNVTGLSCGQSDGAFRIVHNVGSNALVLKNQNASSTAANRFLFSADVTLAADSSLAIVYDATTARWRSWSRALINTGVTAGTYGSATQAPQIAVDIQGRITSASNVTVTPAVGSITGLGTGVGTWLATPSSANLAAALTDETGSGAAVFATSPTLVTPNLGTPSAATLTNATGLPIATGVSGLGSGVATALATPSSANIASAVTDETGSGALVFATSPSLTTPALGVATGTSIALNGCTLGSHTLCATGTANVSGATTLGGALTYGGVTLSNAVTGTGNMVLSSSPSLTTPALGTPSSATLTNATGLPISSGVSGLGTGVATALGTNVGSAGAPVVNGGALGTPSSGTLTNATGLPIGGLTGLGGGVADFLADTTADDQVWVGSSGSAGAWKTIPDCTDTGGNHLNYTQSTNSFNCGTSTSGGGGSSNPAEPQGRLTLASGAPVMTSSQTGVATVYYTPYKGLYFPDPGNSFTMTSIGAELSLALDSDSGHTGYHQSGKIFDLFLANDGGTKRLCSGPAWSSDSARGAGAGTTELEYASGFRVNKVSMTCRFGSVSGNTVTCGVNGCLYVGSMRATADGQTSYTFPATGAGPTAGVFGLWNAYHRRATPIMFGDSTASYTYNSTTIREAGGNTTYAVSILMGLQEDTVDLHYSINVQAATSGDYLICGFGDGSTTTFNFGFGNTSGNVNSVFSACQADYKGTFLGYKTITPNEKVSAAQTVTSYPNTSSISPQNGLTGNIWN